MTHVRQKARLQIGDAPQLLRIIVEFRIECDHPAIGLFQLAGVQLGDLGLAITQFLQGAEQFLVLDLKLFQQSLGPVLRQLARDPSQLVLGQWGCPLWQSLDHRDGDPVLRRSDLELVHQPFRAQDSDSQAGRRVIPSVQDRLEVLDPRAPLLNADQKSRRGTCADLELDLPTSRVLEGIAGNLRHRRGDARLIERGEAQQAGDLAGTLPRQHDVGLQADV